MAEPKIKRAVGKANPNARAMARANANASFKRPGMDMDRGSSMKQGRARSANTRSAALAKGKARVVKPKGLAKGPTLEGIGKFAQGVSSNYAKGVAMTGAAVGKMASDASKFISGGGVVGGREGIQNAMKTGADKSNPLHRILGKRR